MDEEFYAHMRDAQDRLREARIDLLVLHRNLIHISPLPNGVVEAQVDGDVSEAVSAMIDDLQEAFPHHDISIVPARGTPEFRDLRRTLNLRHLEIEALAGLETIALIPNGDEPFLRVGVRKGSTIRALQEMFSDIRLEVVDMLTPSKGGAPSP